MMATQLVCVIVLLSPVVADPSFSISKSLFKNYDAGMRPVCNSTNGTVTVTLDLAIRQLIGLDEPSQIIKLVVWVSMNWHDCRLKWSPELYDGIGKIVVPAERAWLPDMTLYDRISRGFEEIHGLRAIIYSDGTVSYNFPVITESSCKVNVKHFPFDSQECKLIFSSWVYGGSEINTVYGTPYADLDNMDTNVEWEVVSVPAVRHVVKYACCVVPWPDVTYYLELKRKSAYYVFQIIIPCSLISALGMLSFILPPESGEKVSVGVTVLLSQAVFLMLIGDLLPPSSETLPIIAIYFDFAMILIGFACLTAVITLKVFYGENKAIPNWTRSFFFGTLAKMVRVSVPTRKAIKVGSLPPTESQV
ncbi:hypothetical protein ScPMuIL_017758 [Solemya velum]